MSTKLVRGSAIGGGADCRVQPPTGLKSVPLLSTMAFILAQIGVMVHFSRIYKELIFAGHRKSLCRLNTHQIAYISFIWRMYWQL